MKLLERLLSSGCFDIFLFNEEEEEGNSIQGDGQLLEK